METQKINVKVENVLFRKKESDWSIIKTNAGIVKGKIAWEPKVGENILLYGSYETYNGEKQFAFFKAESIIPEDPETECKYACELTHGLGEKMAEKIFEAKGEDWKGIQKGEIPGLTEEKHRALMDTIEILEGQKERTKAITFLISKGCSTNLAEKAFEKFGTGTIAEITNNCYMLASLPRIGFKQIDTTIRHAFAISDYDDNRIESGILYALEELLKDGSSYTELPTLISSSVELLNVDVNKVNEIGRKLYREGLIASYPEHNVITKPEYKRYEETIWEYVNTICSIPF